MRIENFNPEIKAKLEYWEKRIKRYKDAKYKNWAVYWDERYNSIFLETWDLDLIKKVAKRLNEIIRFNEVDGYFLILEELYKK